MEESPGFAVGVLEQLVMLRTRKPMEAASLEALFRATTAQMQTYGPRLLYVMIPGAKQPKIDPDVQRRIATVWPRIQAQSAAGVMWVRNPGFTGALNRRQLTELLPHLRDRSALGVTSSAAETIDFFLNHVPGLKLDTQTLLHALDGFAARYD